MLGKFIFTDQATTSVFWDTTFRFVGANSVFFDTPFRLNKYIAILKQLLNVDVFYYLCRSSDWFLNIKEAILSYISNISINGGKVGGSNNINQVDLFSPSDEKVLWQRLCPY